MPSAAPPTEEVAQELVDGGQLRAHPGGVATGGLDRALGLAQRAAGLLGLLIGLLARLAGLGERGVELGDLGGGRLAGALQLGELALQLLLALALQLGELLLDRADALEDPTIRAVCARSVAVGIESPARTLRRSFLQQLDLMRGAQDPLGEAGGCGGGLLAAQLQPLGGGSRVQRAPRELIVALGALGECPLGEGAPGDNLLQAAFDLRARGPGRLHQGLGLGELQAAHAQRLARQQQARFEHLALEALVQLGGLGLTLERAQTGAGLALDVKRAVEVVLGAFELQLGAAAALAVLAEAGGLLDQEAAVAGLGVDDRVDAALGDDRVGLLAETGVGEHLDHVHEPTAGAVEPVLALARTVQAAQDRDLAERQRDGAVGVVEHELDLGGAAGLHTAAAAEDHVLHRLPAHRQRGLLAHRPQHGVGDVGLARPVGPDHHGDARAEIEAGAVGEGLEALQRERLQIHGPEPACRRWIGVLSRSRA